MFVWPLIALVSILSAVWFFGVRKPASIRDADAARRLVRDADPDFFPGEVTLDLDGTRALVADASGRVVMVLFALGSQVVMRELSPAAVRRIDVVDAGEGCRRVTVLLHDLGCPRVSLTLPAADAARWRDRLDRLSGAMRCPSAAH